MKRVRSPARRARAIVVVLLALALAGMQTQPAWAGAASPTSTGRIANYNDCGSIGYKVSSGSYLYVVTCAALTSSTFQSETSAYQNPIFNNSSGPVGWNYIELFAQIRYNANIYVDSSNCNILGATAQMYEISSFNNSVFCLKAWPRGTPAHWYSDGYVRSNDYCTGCAGVINGDIAGYVAYSPNNLYG